MVGKDEGMSLLPLFNNHSKDKAAGGKTSRGSYLHTSYNLQRDFILEKVSSSPGDCPSHKSTEYQELELQLKIVEKFQKLANGSLPHFPGYYTERGALVVTCSNDCTRDWLMSSVVNLELDGVRDLWRGRQGGGLEGDEVRV